MLCTYLHRTVMFEDNSNNKNYCDSLIGESDHGFKDNNNIESFQQIVTTCRGKKKYA